MFKAFLLIQNPLINPPAREKYPNWRLYPLLAYMNFIFPTAWLLGIKIAINEMTMGFQGMHIDKRQIYTRQKVTASKLMP